jgi:UDP-N-acetylglucosamine--N-acetylmuramyl-(pentapeptide) pyrophosphoryl-undecaprenol N-acetylglucosamine transferase
MKCMIACGGTGGHLFPGLAVAETLLQRRHTVQVVVSQKAVDSVSLQTWSSSQPAGQLGLAAITAVGYSGSPRLMAFCSGLARAARECAALCHAFEPDVVLGMGGFTSAPAVLAARWRGTPCVIHESNAVPGKANRWSGRLARHVAVGLPECAAHFRGRPVTVTGTPVRGALRRGPVPDARARWGLDRGRLTILVMGGSQGAQALNEALPCALPWLETWTDRVQFVHLAGRGAEGPVREAYERNGCAARVLGFCDEMPVAYSVADLVVARAGAATLTELAAFGLPAVLVPYPQAAGNHQWHNARAFVAAGAARLLEQREIETGHHAARGERLAEVLAALLADAPQRAAMAAAMRRLAPPDAAGQIAAILESYAANGNNGSHTPAGH